MKITTLDEFIELNKIELPEQTIFLRLVKNLSFYKDDSGTIGNVN